MRTAIAALALVLTACGAGAAPAAATVDKARGEVRFAATVQPRAMARPFGVQGHHAIVWKGGRAKTWALFAADASDREVRIALHEIGARAGENLTAASWNAREDRTNSEPDKRVAGSRIEALVEWKGSGRRIPLLELLAEKGRPAPLLDLRFGGNQAWQAEFKSGCIVCLYSCPGGAIGNHAHPIRDYVRDGVVYSSRADRLPAPGTRVTIILRLLSNP